MEDIKKANCNYGRSTSKKFKLKSQKSSGSGDNNAKRMVEAEEAAIKEREVEERAVREKEAKKAARRKRKAEEEARKEKKEEEERRKDIEEFDKKIRELELQKSRLLFNKTGKTIS
jgi:oxalate decarboxylase/phosphoglucose isomerase-like protein (cupin superfamily)